MTDPWKEWTDTLPRPSILAVQYHGHDALLMFTKDGDTEVKAPPRTLELLLRDRGMKGIGIAHKGGANRARGRKRPLFKWSLERKRLYRVTTIHCYLLCKDLPVKDMIELRLRYS